jgi:cytochrome c
MIRNVLAGAIIISCLVSCGSKNDKAAGDKVSDTVVADTGSPELSNNPVYQKGLALVADPGNNCLTCHKIDEKLTGPSYRDVANKYANAPDTIISYLAGKIIKGGTGTWGEIPMTPHSDLSQEDAEAMVKYILLLKN